MDFTWLWVYLAVGVVLWLIFATIVVVEDGGIDREELVAVWPVATLLTIFIVLLWPIAILILFAMAVAEDG